jgi:hypothetical protein
MDASLIDQAIGIVLALGVGGGLTFYIIEGSHRLATWRAGKLQVVRIHLDDKWRLRHFTVRFGHKTFGLVLHGHEVFYADTGMKLKGSWHDAVKERLEGWCRLKDWGAFSEEAQAVKGIGKGRSHIEIQDPPRVLALEEWENAQSAAAQMKDDGWR